MPAEKALPKHKLTYGQDLWDSLTSVRDATEHRQKTMGSLRNFFKSYKKALDGFRDGVRKALFVYEKEVLAPDSKRAGTDEQKSFFGSFTTKKKADERVSMVDTLGSCLFNCKLNIEDVMALTD